MKWNWQQPDWPGFKYDPAALRPLEDEFLRQAGRWRGSFVHLGPGQQEILQVQLMSQEAFQTSKIEGDILDRDSIQASIRRLLGLGYLPGRSRPGEHAIASLMVSVYQSFDQDLDHARLHEWHRMLTHGRQDLQDIGCYRTHAEPMQIVSGPLSRLMVHFEAPPSGQVEAEMERFLQWFANTRPGAQGSLPALARAGIAHLYFESIHPFEDGNGRLGRALVAKVLSQDMGFPSLVMVADAIEKQRKAYYEQLGKASQSNQVDEWLSWFGQLVISAQQSTYDSLQFLLNKGKLMSRLHGLLNERQEKVLLRMFEEGPTGFDGGLSARNYQRITGASAATTTRDLQELVEWEALYKTGELKGTRYWLRDLSSPQV